MDGVGVILGVSLQDFSGRQQLHIRNSTRQEFKDTPSHPVIHQVYDDTGCQEWLVKPLHMIPPIIPHLWRNKTKLAYCHASSGVTREWQGFRRPRSKVLAVGITEVVHRNCH